MSNNYNGIVVAPLMTNGGHSAHNQHARIDKANGETTFFSYGTMIAEIHNQQDCREIIMYPSWDFSRTTMKYLWKFLRKYANISADSRKMTMFIKCGFAIDNEYQAWVVKDASYE